jgi:hypothetical protein
VSESASVESPASWRVPARWVSLGLGGVSLGIGVYGILHNRSLVSQFDGGCGIDPTTNMARALSGSTTQTDASCASLKSSYESASTLGAIGLVGAGVFVAAGVVIWLTDPPSKAVRTALGSCAPGPTSGSGFSVACALRF